MDTYIPTGKRKSGGLAKHCRLSFKYVNIVCSMMMMMMIIMVTSFSMRNSTRNLVLGKIDSLKEIT